MLLESVKFPNASTCLKTCIIFDSQTFECNHATLYRNLPLLHTHMCVQKKRWIGNQIQAVVFCDSGGGQQLLRRNASASVRGPSFVRTRPENCLDWVVGFNSSSHFLCLIYSIGFPCMFFVNCFATPFMKSSKNIWWMCSEFGEYVGVELKINLANFDDSVCVCVSAYFFSEQTGHPTYLCFF